MTDFKPPQIGFYIDVPAPGGFRKLELSQKQVREYKHDPVGFLASTEGLTKEEYLRWLAQGFAARCGATTKKGRRCKQQVTGGASVDAARWKKLDGQYCEKHG